MPNNIERSSLTPSRKSNTLLNKFHTYLKRFFNFKQHSFEESVSELINDHREDLSVHTEEKMILQNIITFGDILVSDVMVPRTEITAAPDFIELNKLKTLFMEKGHSRIPIYKDNIDQIIGFVHIKDLFKMLTTIESNFDLHEICRDIIFVPRTMKAADLLTHMKQTATHIAIVLDEHGGTDGLVTIEDIMEEIVGEIYDEYDETSAEFGIDILDNGQLIVDARSKIETVFETLGIKLLETNLKYDTIGGFITSYIQRIPLIAEKIDHPCGISIEIIDADERKIKKVKIYLKPPSE